MYLVYFVDEEGHSYTNFGLSQKFGKSDEFVLKEFESLDKAQKYANAFIRRYPHAIASIDRDDEVVEILKNKEYWKWKENYRKKWEKTYSQLNKLRLFFTFVLLFISISLITLGEHFLSVYGFLLWEKMLISPIVILLFWWAIERFWIRGG